MGDFSQEELEQIEERKERLVWSTEQGQWIIEEQ